MCLPKFWNKIYTKEVDNIDSRESHLFILAERSDFEIFEMEIILARDEAISSLANKVKKAIDSLESYRDCDCSTKTGTCIKHLSNVVIDNITKGAKSVVISGRR